MRLVVKIENGQKVEQFFVLSEPELPFRDPFLEQQLSRWLRCLVGAVTKSRVCKSFTVSVHVDGEGCDHGVSS